MNFYIADLHLFHRNVTGEGRNFDNRPFNTVAEMHAEIISRWCSRVTDRDTVYVLGDVCLSKGMALDALDIISSLTGRKALIRGNHDLLPDSEYLRVFREVRDYAEITDTADGSKVRLVLSHYPILMWKGQHRGAVLLYGHVHNSSEYTYFDKCVKAMNADGFEAKISGGHTIRAYNVGCMTPYMGYAPRTLEEILSGAGKHG